MLCEFPRRRFLQTCQVQSALATRHDLALGGIFLYFTTLPLANPKTLDTTSSLLHVFALSTYPSSLSARGVFSTLEYLSLIHGHRHGNSPSLHAPPNSTPPRAHQTHTSPHFSPPPITCFPATSTGEIQLRRHHHVCLRQRTSF